MKFENVEPCQILGSHKKETNKYFSYLLRCYQDHCLMRVLLALRFKSFLYAEHGDASQWVILKLNPVLRTPGDSISKNIIDVFSEAQPFCMKNFTFY